MPGSEAPTPICTPEEARNAATLGRLHDAMNSGDPERIAQTVDELVAPDALIHTPLPLDATGRDLLKEAWSRLLCAYPDLHISVEDLIAKDDKIVCRQSVDATHLGELPAAAG